MSLQVTVYPNNHMHVSLYLPIHVYVYRYYGRRQFQCRHDVANLAESSGVILIELAERAAATLSSKIPPS